jgi:pimeloyl-ACP methyl ester carboxylesterase
MASPEQPKTFVLVHGAFHGAWCWKDVAARLRARGHVVYTPTFTGLGERSHLIGFGPKVATWIEDVAQLVAFEDLSDVVLVGHSFGGSVVSGMADRMPERLRHLVYLDAMVLQSGQSALDTAGPAHIGRYRDRAFEKDGVQVVPPSAPEYYGVTDRELGRWLSTKLTPHPLNAFYEPLALHHPVGNGLPATYVACTQPYLASTATSRDYAKARADWTYVELATGHNAMMLVPHDLTSLLDDVG